jgi:hypothetical protein
MHHSEPRRPACRVGPHPRPVAEGHAHAWRHRSRHVTSDGVLSYQHCDCGRWRLLLGPDHVVAST